MVYDNFFFGFFFFHPSIAAIMNMGISAEVNGKQTGAVLPYRCWKEEWWQSKSDVLWKLHEVYVIIVTQYFES